MRGNRTGRLLSLRERYHALNGPRGADSAQSYLVDDATHLNQAGHQLVARTLDDLGYAPLVP